jgi:hypothetical protein
MLYATLYSYLRTYLAVRKAIAANESKIYAAMKYDRPCCQEEWSQKKGLFILWCLENIDCYEDLNNTDKMLSVANRWSKNCASCSVTTAEVEDFLDTEEGKELAQQSGLGNYLEIQDGSWLLQQNGYQIIL